MLDFLEQQGFLDYPDEEEFARNRDLMEARRDFNEACAFYIIDHLEKYGFYHHHTAITSTSVYIKTNAHLQMSIRVSEHTGKPKYRYKFNLDIGGETKVIWDKNIQRFYYSLEAIDKLIEDVANRYRLDADITRIFRV